MNRKAEQHLSKAEGYIAKGDGFYGKAADEIIAAQNADPTLSQREIGERFGKGGAWVGKIVAWRTSGSAPSPFMEPGRETPDVRGAKRVLREAPVEQVEHIIAELPKERQKVIGAAAGHEYLKFRKDREERESRLPEKEKERRKQVKADTEKEVGGMLAPFNALAITDLLEEALSDFRELAADSSLTAELVEKVERVLGEWQTEVEFAKALLGGGE